MICDCCSGFERNEFIVFPGHNHFGVEFLFYSFFQSQSDVKNDFFFCKTFLAYSSCVMPAVASVEYYKSVKEKELPCPVVHPTFKDEVKGEYRVMGLFAKYARGLMSRWIIDNNVKKSEELTGFKIDAYRYSNSESTETRPVFIRSAAARC